MLGYPVEHQLFVERIKRIKYYQDKDGPRPLEIGIGYWEPNNPALNVLEVIKRFNGVTGPAGLI